MLSLQISCVHRVTWSALCASYWLYDRNPGLQHSTVRTQIALDSFEVRTQSIERAAFKLGMQRRNSPSSVEGECTSRLVLKQPDTSARLLKHCEKLMEVMWLPLGIGFMAAAEED
jgi:hypothetical protein